MPYKPFKNGDLHGGKMTLLAKYGWLYWHHLVLSRLRNGERIVFHFQPLPPPLLPLIDHSNPAPAGHTDSRVEGVQGQPGLLPLFHAPLSPTQPRARLLAKVLTSPFKACFPPLTLTYGYCALNPVILCLLCCCYLIF